MADSFGMIVIGLPKTLYYFVFIFIPLLILFFGIIADEVRKALLLIEALAVGIGTLLVSFHTYALLTTVSTECSGEMCGLRVFFPTLLVITFVGMCSVIGLTTLVRKVCDYDREVASLKHGSILLLVFCIVGIFFSLVFGATGIRLAL